MRRRWMAPPTSTRGSAYDLRHGPPLLQGLAQAYAVPELLLAQWWRALSQAQWSQASQWREALCRFRPTHPTAQAFWEEACTPTAVVTILEGLVKEGTLYRQTASQIEERLLRHVDAHGQWRGTAPRGTHDAA